MSSPSSLDDRRLRVAARGQVMRDAWRSYAAGSEAKHFAEFAREHLIHERLERIAERGDLVHYGPGTGKHVAIIVSKPGTGVPMVVTWGDKDGGNPRMDEYNYRSDIAEFRRYI